MQQQQRSNNQKPKWVMTAGVGCRLKRRTFNYGRSLGAEGGGEHVSTYAPTHIHTTTTSFFFIPLSHWHANLWPAAYTKLLLQNFFTHCWLLLPPLSHPRHAMAVVNAVRNKCRQLLLLLLLLLLLHTYGCTAIACALVATSFPPSLLLAIYARYSSSYVCMRAFVMYLFLILYFDFCILLLVCSVTFWYCFLQ